MWTKQFWLDTAERALKTAAQAVSSLWAVTTFTDLIDFAANAQSLAVAGLAAAGFSVLTSLGSAPFAQKGTASLVDGVSYEPKHAAE